MVFHGASDVSAAVFLDETHFAAADDEMNGLLVYDVNTPGHPVSMLDLGVFLKVASKFPEADIEGAARMGDRIYWITSQRAQFRRQDASESMPFFLYSVNHSRKPAAA